MNILKYLTMAVFLFAIAMVIYGEIAGTPSERKERQTERSIEELMQEGIVFCARNPDLVEQPGGEACVRQYMKDAVWLSRNADQLEKAMESGVKQ